MSHSTFVSRPREDRAQEAEEAAFGLFDRAAQTVPAVDAA
jgi:hypothetical protein